MLVFATSGSAALINFIVGWAGLGVGVGGFWITLVQLSRVKAVSQGQEEAIANLKLRLAGFDAIQECAHAQTYLDAIREAVQKLDKPAAIANYDRLAVSLLSLSESGYVAIDITTKLQEAASRIGVLSNGLEQADIAKWSITKQLETARYFHALLMQVRFLINKDH